MRTARRVMLVAIAAVGVALSGAAQTASQKCVGAVHKAFPGEGTVWVVAARGAADHTVLEWRSADGRLGVCRLEPDGRITDVRATGVAPPKGVTAAPVAPAMEAFDPYQLQCESEHGGRHECAIKPAATVVMVEQLGDVDCMENISWGQAGEAIWVDGGCRAVFEVRPRSPQVDVAALPAPAAAQSGEGMAHPRFRETRAQDQCRSAAAASGMMLQRFLGTRIDGDAVVVLMEVESWSQRREVTCRWDSTTDQAVIAR